MRLASFSRGNHATYGVVAGDGVVDLKRRLRTEYPDLRALLALGGLAAAARIAQSEAPDYPLSSVTWLPVIPNADKFLCVGLNYRAHIREVGRKIEEHPVIFLRLASSHVGHLQPILRPKQSQQFDYEGELAVVIGKEARHVSSEDALRHVAGYSIYNDGSVRDWQRHTHQYTPGKNFPASGAFGPWMVTAEEIPDPARLHLTTRLNGETVQDSGIDDLVFGVPALIAYLSAFTTLVPGDVILTGTPGGVGAARKPPLWMKPGDQIEVEISSIGTLRNPVAQEA
jgi:2-keto-4-pentenoate hydratase/2-oxohepta-3-ene-1,7-dioic acid hydratase in catechol pathway